MRNRSQDKQQQGDDAKRDVWRLARRQAAEKIEEPTPLVAARAAAARYWRGARGRSPRRRPGVVECPQRRHVIRSSEARDIQDRHLVVGYGQSRDRWNRRAQRSENDPPAARRPPTARPPPPPPPPPPKAHPAFPDKKPPPVCACNTTTSPPPPPR